MVIDSPPALMAVEEALQIIISCATQKRVGDEVVPVWQGNGHILRCDVVARVSNPIADVSAMDGYALRFADVGKVTAFTVSGCSRAGKPWDKDIGGGLNDLLTGQAIEIFTGGILPNNTDTVIPLENTLMQSTNEFTLNTQNCQYEQYIRSKGADFSIGDVVVKAPTLLYSRLLSLIAAANCPYVNVSRSVRVALLSVGDELIFPGDPPDPLRSLHTIPSSNAIGLKAMLAARGVEVAVFPVIPDREKELVEALSSALEYDLIITTGGAWLSTYDCVVEAIAKIGGVFHVRGVAMRPGKPFSFAELDSTLIACLPGNPVSALVCGHVMLMPVIDALQGLPCTPVQKKLIPLATSLPANGGNIHYMRAALEVTPFGLQCRPFENQDSAMLSVLANADVLAVRPPFSPPSAVGDAIPIIPL
jgi:molybdopterin molybdotransferase